MGFASDGLVTGVAASGGSNDGRSDKGESELGEGFNGVRNGDLNGLCSVLAASFSRCRLAWGVDIVAISWALGSMRS